MKIKVKNEQVRKNIELFKLILRKVHQNLDKGSTNDGIVVKGMFNKENGEVQFTDINSKPQDTTFWIPVEFRFQTTNSLTNVPKCEVVSPDGVDIINECSLLAQEIIKQTKKNLLIILQILPKTTTLNDLCLEISKIRVDLADNSCRTLDVIYETWHQISRLESEDILCKYPPGTYLFRKDEYAALLENQLSLAHKIDIKCVTLSYANLVSTVCEIVLVKVPNGWLVYNDDPRLLEPTYPDIETFLDNMKGVLKKPLLVK
ncbi:MAG: hypothetical protein FJZ57_00510 [Chlamydiae bacterium]|nr:hypothetical protein [Chlamydiota bacterium]